jgi:hypothetical protein
LGPCLVSLAVGTILIKFINKGSLVIPDFLEWAVMSCSRKGFSNSLYKGFITVNYIHSELIPIKFQQLILSFESVIAFSYLSVIA